MTAADTRSPMMMMIDVDRVLSLLCACLNSTS